MEEYAYILDYLPQGLSFKNKDRMWIREGDLLIISIWDFQPDKCDVRFRYTKTQAVNLSKRNKVPKNLDIF